MYRNDKFCLELRMTTKKYTLSLFSNACLPYNSNDASLYSRQTCECMDASSASNNDVANDK